MLLHFKSFDEKNVVVDEEHSNRSSHSPESGLGSTGHLAPGHSLLAGSQFQVCNFYNNFFISNCYSNLTFWSNVTWGGIKSPSQDIDSENAEEDEFYDQEPLPVLGRCKAIYTFEGNFNFDRNFYTFEGNFQMFSFLSNISSFPASSEGSIPLEEQEELWLIETDQGDGWTRSYVSAPLTLFLTFFNLGSGGFTHHTLIRCLRVLFLRLI